MTDTRPIPRRPTMRDVARRSGVSTKTVSRVINGEGGASSETVERILAAVAELGYQRDLLASELRSAQPASAVGVIIEDVSNPFYGSMLRAMEEVAREKGAMLLTASSDEDPQRQRELVESLVSRRVAGLLVVSAASHHEDLALQIERGLAVVFVDRLPTDLACDAVIVDNERGANEGVTHLLRQGHRRIALVGDHEWIYTVQTRRAGYEKALDDAGVTVPPELVRLGCHLTSEATAATHELLDLAEPPTAIFTTNNRATVGTLRAVRSRDAQVAVLGFDDFELADLLKPPVSVIAQDPAEIGMMAARRLFARIEGDDSPPQILRSPSRLLVRS